MRFLKPVYIVFRSIIMSLIVLLVIVYVGLYVILSVPSVQNKVRERVSQETSQLLGGTVEIKKLSVHPFSEVILSDVTLLSPEGERCASIGKVAAGIDLWSLFSDRRIVLNYAEIISLYANIEQSSPGSPLNIQFLIDALSPKDKTKPAAPFDVRIRNVVVRDSRALFSRVWLTDSSGTPERFSRIEVDGLRMDLSIPTLKNDLFRFDVRNIQFVASPGFTVRGLSAQVSYIKDPLRLSPDRLAVNDFKLNLPHTSIAVGDLDVRLDSLPDLDAVVNGMVTPSDFSELIPCLASFDTPWNIDVDACLKERTLALSSFILSHPGSGSSVKLNGEVSGLGRKDSIDATVDELKADLSPLVISEVAECVPGLNERSREIINSLGRVEVGLTGSLHPCGEAEADGSVMTSVGRLDFSVSGSRLLSNARHVSLAAEADGVQLGDILSSDKVGKVSASLKAEVTGSGREAEGFVHISSDDCMLMGNLLNGLEIGVEKDASDIDVSLEASSKDLSLSLIGKALLAGADSHMDARLNISGFRPSEFGMSGGLADCEIRTDITVSSDGDNVDNITGLMDVRDFSMMRSDGRKLNLSRLLVAIDTLRSETDNDLASAKCLARDIRVESDWLDARVSGFISPGGLPSEMKRMVASVFPSFISTDASMAGEPPAVNDFTFDINVKGVTDPYAFFDTPVRPLTDIPVKGSVDAPDGKVSFCISTPHLQQGRNKLISDVCMNLELDSFLGMAKLNAGLIFPAKKGDAELAADIYAVRDKVNVNLGINPTMKSVVKGSIALEVAFSRLQDPFNAAGKPAVSVKFIPSAVSVNDKSWMIADGGIDYSGKRISISNFLISHDDQFVKIDGTASESADDFVSVRLNDIDLDYIFNILNINYVSFGGMATGEVVGSRLLTKDPEAFTRFLRVKGLSYNGAELGDGDLASEYDAQEKKVGIYAVIRDPLTRERRASIDGGIWVTRDSLSFGFDANKVNVGIMKPFVSAFCSDLYGQASGKCKLFGNFSDIDLIGDLKADTLSMKLDFTNTWYHAGGDSVFLHTGVIDIPPMTLYDDERHTAEFSGWLRHRYFHEPVFNFRLKDAKSLLCYDTNEKINPLWYGTIYGSGHAQINGYPGLIEIDMNMTTEENSRFYYVISDAEDVAQYSFLSFTDKRKESTKAAEVDSVPDYLMKFRKQTQAMEEGSSNVMLSLKGTVTNDALVTLVMDPKAGDNITARGQGALQMDYNLASNDLRMIGTYVLDEGNYNFTLQDIIIKNFNIRKGSLIKFDGDPMRASLDITATYRVNTNLTDLDKSFSTDKELNRTNVPVDAVLLVDGPMTNPDITFDIELPSLTSDVERKVKSIVSTNDMMSRQIIYLLALNRFYTPEYTGGQSNGSEWSSMASSTISSQLSNILSQMTDKLDVAPSFRSEKGDFSDMEFDLALSSRLLNNRLLINGNFGYRDRTTSNTQFVGDFDIEYLLSKNGNLRLKAYNHFNDQNYYLRSALTTQGVGVVFRRDFDHLFGRRKEVMKENDESRADSVSVPEVDHFGQEESLRPDSVGR